MRRRSLNIENAGQKNGYCDRYFLEERVVVRHSLKSLSRFVDSNGQATFTSFRRL